MYWSCEFCRIACCCGQRRINLHWLWVFRLRRADRILWKRSTKLRWAGFPFPSVLPTIAVWLCSIREHWKDHLRKVPRFSSTCVIEQKTSESEKKHGKASRSLRQDIGITLKWKKKRQKAATSVVSAGECGPQCCLRCHAEMEAHWKCVLFLYTHPPWLQSFFTCPTNTIEANGTWQAWNGWCFSCGMI